MTKDNTWLFNSSPNSPCCLDLLLKLRINLRLESGLLALVAVIFGVWNNHGKWDGGPGWHMYMQGSFCI